MSGFAVAHPLALLLLPLAGYAAVRRRRPAAAIAWPGIEAVPATPSRLPWLAAVLDAVAWALIVAAIADVRRPELLDHRDGWSVMLVVDASGSMAEADFPAADGRRVRRWDAVRDALRPWVAARPSDLIGLIAFARQADVLAPLTADHGAILRQLDAEEPRTSPADADTNVGDAVAVALARLDAAPPGRRLVLLVSDGEHNVPPPALSPSQAGRLAAALGVPVVCLDVGGDDDSPQRESGRDALAALATQSGGQIAKIDDATALAAALPANGDLPGVGSPRDWRPLGAWLAAGAMAAAAWLDRRIGGRLP